MTYAKRCFLVYTPFPSFHFYQSGPFFVFVFGHLVPVKVSFWAFGIATLLFTAFGLAGFARFGDEVPSAEGTPFPDLIPRRAMLCRVVPIYLFHIYNIY